MKPIRVLIVDDSPTVQSVLTSVLSGEPDIEVIGTASDAFEAKDMIVEKRPDVITLDIEMPRMDGITFLKRLMSFRPVPVIMISSYTHENSLRTLEALDAGAVDFVAKPTGDVKAGLRKLKREITTKVRGAAQARIKTSVLFGKPEKAGLAPKVRSSDKIIAIGASTGGTQAIQRLLRAIPSDVNGIVIVQHMPARFTKAFAQRLDTLFPMDIKEAEDGDRLDRGKVLVAPGGWHLLVAKDHKGYCVRLQNGQPVKHQRPSVDVLFHSVAKAAGCNAIGIQLTGMGDDGAEGLLAMKQAGAFTIAQDEATSVVFGMPGAAIKHGAVEVVAALDDIADIVLNRLKS
ncbi:MAG: chemotaxis response regulator protein-glutamate methylesterase [Deltaproteobacteria bacterium]|nr:chemotaxis response regulator protein-glutamate methylesterase [Deltaproteobacteria bacterium]MBW2019186.1 chemotaxis response regulator protein-glutamate methylesterase [Deltaproteobacteria bacterium]MBW2073989.1 chemotaxis response regulator protein-glutamate methylesterase [Deltaproteobacteria bacterium]